MLLQILEEPNEILRKVSQPVDLTNGIPEDIKILINDMIETMYHYSGIGLSAVQVGKLVRVVVYDMNQELGRKSDLRVLINPELYNVDGTPLTNDNSFVIRANGPMKYRKDQKTRNSQEGCLSVPFVFEVIQRLEEVMVKFVDINGNPNQLVVSGLESSCIQHEIDHLNGVLFTDYFSRLKLNQMKKNKEKYMLKSGNKMIKEITSKEKMIALM